MPGEGRRAARGYRGPRNTGLDVEHVEIAPVDEARLGFPLVVPPRIWLEVIPPASTALPPWAWPALVWTYAALPEPEATDRPSRRPEPSRALTEFLRLVRLDSREYGAILEAAGAGDRASQHEFVRFREHALRYAQRFGPIGVCQHLLPLNHLGGTCLLLMEDRGGYVVQVDPLEVWHRLSRVASAILSTAGRHRDGRRADPTVWGVLTDACSPIPGTAEVLETWVRPLAAGAQDQFRGVTPLLWEQWELDLAIAHWLRLARLPLSIHRLDGRPTPTVSPSLNPGGNFGLLATQLAGGYCGGRIAECEACGEIFTDELRRGAPRRYCDECGVKAGLERQRRYWEKPGGGADQRRARRRPRGEVEPVVPPTSPQ